MSSGVCCKLQFQDSGGAGAAGVLRKAETAKAVHPPQSRYGGRESGNRKAEGAAVSGCFLSRRCFTWASHQKDRILRGHPRFRPTKQKEPARSPGRSTSGGDMTFSWTDPFPLMRMLRWGCLFEGMITFADAPDRKS